MLFRIKQRWWSSLAATVVLGSVAWFAGALEHPQGGLGSVGLAVGLGVAAAAGCLAVNFALDRVLRFALGSRYERAFQKFALDVAGRMGARDALAGGLMAGVGEEPFFRALLVPLCGPPVVGVPVVAILFGLAHYLRREYHGFLIWAMGEGLVFGTLFVCTGSFLVPAIAHGVFDTFGFGYFLWLRRSFEAGRGELS